MSAGTISPPRSSTTSPGTSSAAAMSSVRPSRRTRADRSGRRPQRLHRLLGAIGGGDVRADDRQEADEHERTVADLSEEDREDAGHEQQDHERLRDRFPDHRPDRRSLDLLELVRTRPRSPLLDGRRGEAPLRVDAQACRDLRAGARVHGDARLDGGGGRGHAVMVPPPPVVVRGPGVTRVGGVWHVPGSGQMRERGPEGGS